MDIDAILKQLGPSGRLAVALGAGAVLSVLIVKVKNALPVDDILCPECRARGARKRGGKFQCRRSGCPNYDRALADEPATVTPPPAVAPVPPSRGFDPGADSIAVSYRNYQGTDREFVADKTSLRKKGEHITARLAPTGGRVAFAKKFLKNRAELEALATDAAAEEALWKRLTLVERQIVGYHRKRKSTSPRYEEVLRKYPDLQ